MNEQRHLVRYIFLPTRRRIWFDVAQALKAHHGWVPIIWFAPGDTVEEATRLFPESEVYHTSAVNEGLIRPLGPLGLAGQKWPKWLERETLESLKLQVFKMMDRQPGRRTGSLLDREAICYRLIHHFAWQIGALKPDVLLAAEAPHFAGHRVLYEVARSAGIPRFHFTPSSLWPAFFVRDELDGTPLELQDDVKMFRDGVLDREIGVVVEAMARQAYDVDAVRHLAVDRRLGEAGSEVAVWRVWSSAKRVASRAARTLRHPPPRLEVSPIRNESAHHERKSHGSFENKGGAPQKMTLARRVQAMAVEIQTQRTMKADVEALARAYDERTECVPSSEPYVYVPLHYEPERTTNPDGGRFWNQYDMLLELHESLPSDMHMVVREHPAQFGRLGHLGRSPRFYDLLKSLPRTVLVGRGIDPADLIRKAELVATVTGTSALEAACMGRNAMIFGNAWFSGCPGIWTYSGRGTLRIALSEPPSPVSDVEKFLRELIHNFGLPGCTGPVGEQQFARFSDLLYGKRSIRAVADALVQCYERSREETGHRRPDA